MKKKKPVPGPYRVQHPVGIKTIEIVSKSGIFIARVYRKPIPDEQDLATAELLASAPDLQARINDGKVVGSVSKNTTYLVCGDKAGGKKAKAEKLGVKCISEDDLRAWCNSEREAA
ncbi:MAG: hypothetical protein JEZ11_03840 [Desulfobacterales bacterium]|nr:hypothetical protein [Desulfobacterales bacterium]